MRGPSMEDQLNQALDMLEALANHLFTDQHADRKRGNERRLECVQAMQLVKKLRATKIDVEI